MLKIYLDWNIITHLKSDGDDNKEILDALQEYKKFFVYPYSIAHLHDLYSGDSSNPGYTKDLEMIGELCGTHLLEYSYETDCAYPYKCTPKEYLERNSNALQLFSSGFTEEAFQKLFGKWGVDVTKTMNKMAKEKVPPIEFPFLNAQIRNTKEALIAVMRLGERFAKDKKMPRMVERYVKEATGKQYWDIKNSNSDNIFHVIDKITLTQVGKPFAEIVKDYQKQKNEYMFFTSLYLALNTTGFSSDKNRNILNIYTDAEHAYYASKCDVFVTDDSNLKEKAQAIYNLMGIHTKVIEKKQFVNMMEEEVGLEFDLEHFYNVVLPKYGMPSREEGDLLYYKEMPYRFLGLFNYCEKVTLPNSSVTPVVFRLVIPPNGILYYTELQVFFELIESLLDKKGKEIFRHNYRDVFLERKKDKIQNVGITINCGDYIIQLKANQDTDIPLPLMVLIRINGSGSS